MGGITEEVEDAGEGGAGWQDTGATPSQRPPQHGRQRGAPRHPTLTTPPLTLPRLPRNLVGVSPHCQGQGAHSSTTTTSSVTMHTLLMKITYSISFEIRVRPITKTLYNYHSPLFFPCILTWPLPYTFWIYCSVLTNTFHWQHSFLASLQQFV